LWPLSSGQPTWAGQALQAAEKRTGRPNYRQPPLNHTHTLRLPQVKKRLGGHVKVIISGGAPLAPHVEEFLRVAMCAPVVQVRAGAAWRISRLQELWAGRRLGR
jgi:long-subunit acyl-CoA synthetase (AMP-forming)